MMRVLKWLAISAGVVIVLVIVATGALLLWVDPNDYRDRLEQLAESRLGRDLEITGPLELEVFPWLSLEAHQVSLGNPQGFGDAPFAQITSARVGVKLMPLLRRRLEVSRVSVDGLAATLVTRADGRSNWEGLGESETPSAGAEPAPQTSIAGIDITDASLVFRDEAEKSVTRLRGLELHTGALGTGAPVSLDLALIMDEGEGTDATRLGLKATASLPEAGTSRIELAELRIEGEQIPAPEQGEKPAPKVRFTVSAPRLVLDYQAETLAPAKLAIEYGGIPIEVAARGEQLLGERLLQGEFTVPRVSPREVLPALGIELPETPAGTLEIFQASGGWRLTEKQLELSRLVAALDQTKLRGQVAIDDLDAETPPLRFELTADVLNVDRYFPPEPKSADSAAPGGGAAQAAEEPTELPREALAELRAKGALRIGKFTIAGLAFDEVSTVLDARDGLVKLGPTAARLFGGSYRGTTTLDVRSSPARLSLDEHVRDIDLGALLKAALDSERLTGRAYANAVLSARGDTDAALLKALSGRADFDVRDGALQGIDLWYELRRARALWQRDALPQQSGPPRTPFNVLRGSAVLDQGLMRTDDLRAETEYLKVKGSGTLDIATTALDYRLTAEVYKIPPEGAGAEMAAVRAAEIPLAITGTVADAKIRPDFNALVKGRVKQEVEEKVEEQKERLREKLGEKLKDLFDR